MKLVAEICVVPRNLPFAVLGASLLLHTGFRGNIYSKTNKNSAFLLCNKSYKIIIPTQCFYCFFGDFDWSVGNIKLFLHFDKNPCVGIFDNCLDFTVLDCVDNNELYRKLYYFYQIKYS